MRIDHEEQILKGYDPAIMRRLLRYLRPYAALAALALTAVLLSTGAEMLIPVLLKQAVDEHILPYHRKLDPDKLDEEARRKLGLTEAEPADAPSQEGRAGQPGTAEGAVGAGSAEETDLVDGYLFLPTSRLSSLTLADKRRLVERGALFEPNYFVVEIEPPMLPILSRHQALFTRNDRRGAVLESDLEQLSPDEIRVIRSRHWRGLGVLAVKFFAALLGVMVFLFLQVYVMAYVGQRVIKDIRTQLYGHTLGRSLRFIDANPVGRLVTRITNDVETINDLFTSVLASFIKDMSLMIGIMITLFLLNARLALFSMLFLPPVIVSTLVFRRRARDAFRRVRAAVSRINSFLSEHLSGMEVVKMFAREDLSEEEFSQRNHRLLSANLHQMYVFATFRPLVDVLATISIGVVVYFGAWSFLRNLVSVGVLIAFINLVRRFFRPIQDMSEKYSLLQSAMAGSERVFHLMDERDAIPQPEDPVRLDGRPTRGSIVFDQVSFSYKDDEWVIRDLSLELHPGETVAIVGYTGAGKTTLTNLLTRLWDVQRGAILLDGTDIRLYTTDELRSRVQSVLQDVFLFSGTVEENIRLGGDMSREQVVGSARLVRADGFIRKLPEGYDSVLQERGANLSSGQRQLLAFARVIAHDPDVLVLDEATANIDTETESLIQEALGRLLENRTSLIIAHRLSTIKRADRILVLHEGRLVEQGRHEELMRSRGMYFNLYQMQFKQNGAGDRDDGGGGEADRGRFHG